MSSPERERERETGERERGVMSFYFSRKGFNLWGGAGGNNGAAGGGGGAARRLRQRRRGLRFRLQSWMKGWSLRENEL